MLIKIWSDNFYDYFNWPYPICLFIMHFDIVDIAFGNFSFSFAYKFIFKSMDLFFIHFYQQSFTLLIFLLFHLLLLFFLIFIDLDRFDQYYFIFTVLKCAIYATLFDILYLLVVYLDAWYFYLYFFVVVLSFYRDETVVWCTHGFACWFFHGIAQEIIIK